MVLPRAGRAYLRNAVIPLTDDQPRAAELFAEEWIAGWNAHDLPRILAHYEDDFEMASPRIVEVAGEPSGILRGKASVAAYWEKALRLIPDLRFDKLGVFVGSRCIANPHAEKFFAKLEAQNRYAILWRVHNAKKPETRARRIAQFVGMLATGDKPHP